MLPSGASVTLTGQVQGGFASVSYNGTDGWASQSYLSDTGTSSDSGSGVNLDGSYTTDEIIQLIYAAAAKYGRMAMPCWPSRGANRSWIRMPSTPGRMHPACSNSCRAPGPQPPMPAPASLIR